MRYAIIKDGVVVNVAKAAPDFAAAQGWVECPKGVAIGWSYDGSTFTEPVPQPGTKVQVDAERDRRISAGFTWGGHSFQSDRDSRENIMGAATSATAFMLSGGASDEVYWQSQDAPFMWLTVGNSPVQMTPEQVVDFGNSALAHKKAHIFAARALKDMDPIPVDFDDDKYWP